MRETAIAIRDEEGVARKVTKIIQMRDGFAVSVPYHSAKEGWITEHPMHYDSLDVHTVMPCEIEHFTASDRVKLSIHLDGFVQFSRGGDQPTRSGYDKATETVKGVGLKAPTPVVVTSGPTFGIVLRGLKDFAVLPDGKEAEMFEREDLWHHPRDSSPSAQSYHLEGFTFRIELLSEVRDVNGRRILLRQLPFMSILAFRHEL
ncbi:MAG TPA: hypothetical protein PK867_07350, partial [Pirellulales bacterium]|nr:hypothetical protein [Pirellulales bacterium]